MIRPVCDNCGKHRRMHVHTSVDGRTFELCCGCYVKAGREPYDWHPDCLATGRGEINSFNRWSRVLSGP